MNSYRRVSSVDNYLDFYLSLIKMRLIFTLIISYVLYSICLALALKIPDEVNHYWKAFAIFLAYIVPLYMLLNIYLALN